jgi:DNA-binding MarR family transcriptional regulator
MVDKDLIPKSTTEEQSNSLEIAIKQKKFKDPWQKAAINIIYTGSWLKYETTEFLRPFHLTAQQFNVLRILRGQFPNGITTMEIRKRLLDKMSDTSRMVDRLERDGWVEKKKDEIDRRLVSVNISQKGLDVLAQIDSREKEMHRLIYGLKEEEAVQLSRLLDKVRLGLEKRND